MNMTSTIQLSGFLRKEPYPLLLWSLVVVLAIRILLYLLMSSAGYFYGIPWDTFSRTSLAWQWAHQPYFSQSDGNWPPFQFWIVGTTFMVLRPWVDTSSLMVPVITNNLFFAGSVLVTCLMAYRLGGQTAVLWAAILVAFFPADVFVSYSGLTEPMSIFFILYVSYILATTFLDGKTQQSGWSIKVGIATLFATATHYIGWFLAFFVIVFVDYWAVRPLLRRRLGQIALCAVSIILCVIFPVLWLINNFVLWGDPLHFARIAAGYQAAYVGQLTILKRAGIPFKVLLTTFPTLCVLGVVGIV